MSTRTRFEKEAKGKLEMAYYSMLVTLCEMGEVSFHLIGTNGFYVKAETERFTVAGLFCRQNFKFEIFMPSFDRLRQRNVQK